MAVRKSRLRVAAVCVALMLAGCAGHSGTTASPTVSPTVLPIVPHTMEPPPIEREPVTTQEPVAPPTSREAALAAALAVIEADMQAYFDVASRTVPYDSVFAFEGGSYLETTFGFLEALLPDPDFIGVTGEPHLWIPDYSKSSVSALTYDGDSYPYAAVHLVGCVEIRWEIIYEPGALGSGPAIGEVLPSERTIEYDPAERVWLITDGRLLAGEPGAPECPPAM